MSAKKQKKPNRKPQKPPDLSEKFKRDHPHLSNLGWICSAIIIIYSIIGIAQSAFQTIDETMADTGEPLVAILEEHVRILAQSHLLLPLQFLIATSVMVLVVFILLGLYGLINERSMVKRTSVKKNGLPAYPIYTVAVIAALSQPQVPSTLLMIYDPGGPAFVMGAILVLAGFVLLTISRIRIGGRWGININVIHDEQPLATEGVYSIVRHPIYLATNAMYIGYAFMFGSLVVAIFTFLAILMNLSRARREEDALKRIYGKAWEEYAAKTPFIWPRGSRH